MCWIKRYQEIVSDIGENHKKLLQLNCLLKNLTQTHRFSEALNLFHRIHSSHAVEKPDHYTLSAALTASANVKNAAVGARLHAYSIRTGLIAFPHVANPLLSLYAKVGDLELVKRVYDEIENPDVYSRTTLLSACMKVGEVEYSRNVFDEMPQGDVAVWNAFITGSVENGCDWTALGCFKEMLDSGVRGDHYSFASILSLCGRERIEFGRQVHCLSVKTGFLWRPSVVNSLLSMYFDSGIVEDAYGVFNEVGREVGDAITYNVIIGGLASLERNRDALFFFEDMHKIGLRPTEFTFTNVARACLCSEMAHQVHCHVIKRGFEEFTSVSNALISMYSCIGKLDAAHYVFLMLKEKDEVSWNAIITSYAVEQLFKQAISAYTEMQRNGFEPDEFTIGSLLRGTELIETAEMIQAIVVKKALVSKVEVSNALLSAFSRLGEVDRAYKVFKEEVPFKNLISWNAMISGFLTNGLPSHGLRLFSQLLSEYKPNHFTLSLVLTICSCISDISLGKQVHAYVLKFDYFSHTLLGNALINVYAKLGALRYSLRVFEHMAAKDTVSWNSIISAHAQHGEGNEAIKLFESMQNSSDVFLPDKDTLTSVLAAASRSGLLKEGLRIFDSIVNRYKVSPEPLHFSCIVDLLGKSGFLEVAEGLILDGKGDEVEIDFAVWWTLFSSCVAHGQVQLGTVAADFLLRMGKDDAAVYVLLSNLYAGAGEWEDSARFRELMRQCGVTKQPGSSWITS